MFDHFLNFFSHFVDLECFFLFRDSGLFVPDKLCIHCLFTNHITNWPEEKKEINETTSMPIKYPAFLLILTYLNSII